MKHKSTVLDCAINFASGALLAFGIYHIHDTADITEGGVLGLVLLMEHWLRLAPIDPVFPTGHFR